MELPRDEAECSANIFPEILRLSHRHSSCYREHMSRASWPLVIGHRGAPGYRPEHTRASYELAIAQGADALEPDLVVSSDGVLVVRHENEISSTTDVAEHPEFEDRKRVKVVDGQRLRGWFTEDFTWAELSTLRCRERIPDVRPENAQFDGEFPMLRLQDALDLLNAADRDLIAVLEIKHAHYFEQLGFDLAALLMDELAASSWTPRGASLIVESFELGILDRLRDRRLDAQRVFLLESEGAPADERAVHPERAISYADYRTDAQLHRLTGRVDGISVAKRDLFEAAGSQTLQTARTPQTNNLVDRAHRADLSVFTWTLRPENRFLHPVFRDSNDPNQWGDWESEFALILETGVDGVFVDHVDLGIAAREKVVSAHRPTLNGT